MVGRGVDVQKGEETAHTRTHEHNNHAALQGGGKELFERQLHVFDDAYNAHE